MYIYNLSIECNFMTMHTEIHVSSTNYYSCFFYYEMYIYNNLSIANLRQCTQRQIQKQTISCFTIDIQHTDHTVHRHAHTRTNTQTESYSIVSID